MQVKPPSDLVIDNIGMPDHSQGTQTPRKRTLRFLALNIELRVKLALFKKTLEWEMLYL